MGVPLWLNIKYANLLSNKLKRFKRKDRGLFSFRCPFCGDSKKNSSKTRGYFYTRDQKLLFQCHNCGEAMNFQKFLNEVAPELYKDFIRELYQERNNEQPEVFHEEPKVVLKFEPLQKLKRICDLPTDHQARKYLDQRLINPRFYSQFYFASAYGDWVNSFVPDKLPVDFDCARIVIPFFNRNKKLVGFTGRSIEDKYLRYLTIMLDPSEAKIFGMDSVDLSHHVYITEGAFDATFLPNSVAMDGADFRQIFVPNTTTVIYDNEQRNQHIVKRMRTAIERGYNLFIWPKTTDAKDINKMVMNGFSRDSIKKFIDERTFTGLKAKMRMAEWLNR
jgi:transcription elongation factor Elf1